MRGNPVSLIWIPAFAGMTGSVLIKRSVGFISQQILGKHLICTYLPRFFGRVYLRMPDPESFLTQSPFSPAYFQGPSLRLGKIVSLWSKSATKNYRQVKHFSKKLINFRDYATASLGIKVAVIADQQ
jgi:hypothetical protein